MIFKKLSTSQTLFIVTLFSFFTACKTQELSTKVYPFTHEEFKYPEDKFLEDKKNVGIAFSGGGPRSAALTTGQLRALNKLGVLDKVKYISAVSGGAWASIVYSFSDINKDSLLGIYKKPDELKLKDLECNVNGKLINSISDAYVMEKYIKYSECTLFNMNCKGDEIYANILKDIFLDSIKLGEKRYVSYTQKTVEDIIEREKNKGKLKKEDFYISDTKKPYLIVNGTVVGKLWNSWKLPTMHLEMTPLYSGVSYFDETLKRKIGGGYLETFAVDNRYKQKKDENHLIFKKRKNKFSLGDMMAITGNAAGTWANRVRLGGFWGLPEIRFISIPQALKSDKSFKKIKSREFPVSDGGNLENLGLIPLLKRNVKQIIVFVNSKQAIEEITEKNGEKTIKIDNALNRVFGIKIKDNSSAISSTTFSISTLASAILGRKSWIINLPIGLFFILDKDAKKNFIINTNLLGNKNNELDTLAKILYNKKIQGKALIHTATYRVNKNPDYGIYPIKDKTDKVEITWVYNDGFDENYVDKLKKEVRYSYYQKGFNSNKSVFPHLPTFWTSSKGRAIHYKKKWANLLSHFSSWVVMDNQKLFKDFVK